jgi:glutathione S-transferase
MDLKAFSIAQSELKQSLQAFEQHLRLRNFLVGHSLTLADVQLVGLLACAFSCAVDKKSRDANYQNLQRYVSLIMQMPVFTSVYG